MGVSRVWKKGGKGGGEMGVSVMLSIIKDIKKRKTFLNKLSLYILIWNHLQDTLSKRTRQDSV